MSVITANTVHEADNQLVFMSAPDIDAMLRTIAEGHSAVTLATYTSHTKIRAVKEYMLLSRVDKTDNVLVVGNLLYNETVVLLSRCQNKEFGIVVASNYNLDHASIDSAQRRTNLQLEVTRLTTLAADEPLVPNEKQHERMKSASIFDLQEERRASYPAIPAPVVQAPAEGSATRSSSAEAAARTPTATTQALQQQHAYEGHTAYLGHKLQIDMDRVFSAEVQAYQATRKAHSESKAHLLAVNRELLIESYLDAMLNFFAELATACATRVKFFVHSKHPGLEDFMQTNIVIEHTGESIADAYGSLHMAGILHILHERFRKADFVGLATSMFVLFNWRASHLDPASGIAAVERFLQEWIRCKHQQRLTMDTWFSIILANGMPLGSKAREAAIDGVLTETTAQERGTSKYIHEPMPIYTATKTAILDWQKSSQFATTGVETSPASATAPVNATSVSAALSRRSTRDWHRPGSNVETAAAAAVTTTAPIASVPTYGSMATAQSQQSETYSSAITRSDGKCFVDGGRVHAYVAVPSAATICAQCFGKPPKPCRPGGKTCFGAQCTRCGYFGHMQKNCRQTNKLA